MLFFFTPFENCGTDFKLHEIQTLGASLWKPKFWSNWNQVLVKSCKILRCQPWEKICLHLTLPTKLSRLDDISVTEKYANLVTINIHEHFHWKTITPQPLYNTIVGVQANFRVSYPIRVISRVKCIDYIRKGVWNSHLGSNPNPCYIQNRVITNRVIKRFRCISLMQHNKVGGWKADLGQKPICHPQTVPVLRSLRLWSTWDTQWPGIGSQHHKPLNGCFCLYLLYTYLILQAIYFRDIHEADFREKLIAVKIQYFHYS